MSRIILAVGGGGQMVLHHYVQLHLIGVVREGFTAYVVDSDEPIRSLEFLARFLDDVRAALGPAAEQAQVPSVRLVRLERGRQGATVADILTQQRELPGEPGFHHVAQAFFTRETLHQDVRMGLFARPALSAVMALRETLEHLQPERWPREARVTLTCSCIGGTGGGIAIPLLWHLANARGADFQLRAVFLGQYFRPRAGGAVGDDVARFRSNRAGFLKAAEQSVGELNAYAFVEEPAMPERDPEREKAADQLPWAQAEEPYWLGAAALDYLLNETVGARESEFARREVNPNNYTRRLDRGAAEQALRAALGRADSFRRRRVLIQIGREAPVRSIWGNELIDALTRYWSLSNKAGWKNTPNGFLGDIHSQFIELWRRGTYSMSSVFPGVIADNATPWEIRDVRWLAPPDDVDLAPYRDPQSAGRRIAAALLYAALRNVR